MAVRFLYLLMLFQIFAAHLLSTVLFRTVFATVIDLGFLCVCFPLCRKWCASQER